MHPTIKKIADCGQSIWYDNIRRGMLHSGEMQQLIDEGVVGVTSNPTIFQKAICESGDYDDELRRLVADGLSAEQIYDQLTIEDIRTTADLFRPVYDRTDRRDGFVSIEVNPRLAFDTKATIAEARRLFKTVSRPNVMVKIPGTEEGLDAIKTAIGEGINVNVTLIFGIGPYERIMDAYLHGLETFLSAGGDPTRIASVASFFVSRVDSVVDKQLQQRIDSGDPECRDLLGKAAVANSKLAYARYKAIFTGHKFASLQARGARVQRPLWASTSTKNPDYSPTLYVAPLIGPDTVNTVPHVTLDAIRAGFDVIATVERDFDQAYGMLERINKLGIDMEKVTTDLRIAGVKAFADSFEQLIADVESKREAIASR